jgi:hypothetical protein
MNRVNCEQAFERHSYPDTELLSWNLLTQRTCVSLAQHEKSAIAAEDMVARKLAWLEHMIDMADRTSVISRSRLEERIDRQSRRYLQVIFKAKYDVQRHSDCKEDTQANFQERRCAAEDQD